MRQLLPIVSCLFIATPAFAQAVDAEGAQRLSDDLARYVGQGAFTSHVVTVTPEGSAYRIAVDFKQIAGLLAPLDAGAKLDLTPLAVLAKPLPDGTWDVASDALPGGSIEIDTPQGRQSMQWTITGARFKGIFDPTLAAFRTMTGSQSGMTMVSREANQEVHASIGAGTFALTGTASAGGGVDFTMSQVMSDFVETVQVGEQPDVPALPPVTIKAASLSVDATGQGYRIRALLDLLAFGIANAEEARIKANQAELKSLLRAVLPVWNRIDGSYRFDDISVETPLGAFGAKSMGLAFGMDGAVANGSMSYSQTVTGVTMPEQLLPMWSRPLLPTDADISVSAVGFNLDGMARKLIESFDLNQEPPVPATVGAEIGAEFMAKPPKVVISRSTVKGRNAEVAAEGEVTFVGGKPAADIAYEVDGYDEIVEVVKQAANDEPELGQFLAVALAAKGFAKTTSEGRLRWEMQLKPDGSISVNGVTLKGPDPQ